MVFKVQDGCLSNISCFNGLWMHVPSSEVSCASSAGESYPDSDRNQANTVICELIRPESNL